MNDILQGDCLEILKTLPDNSVDAVITDPPYGLGFMNKEWDSPKKHRELIERESKRSEQRFLEGKSPTTAPFSKSVMPGLPIKGAKEGKWFQDWCFLWAQECLRVLKPGGHLLSFSATRTYHRMACAIEDAGFEVRDMIEWCYGSGFPKSLNIGKAVDKLQGNEREVVGTKRCGIADSPFGSCEEERKHINETKGTSAWEGWGTALKPAHEPICLARKPLSEKSVAENVLNWGTGGINIDESRVGFVNENDRKGTQVGFDVNNVVRNEGQKWGLNKNVHNNKPSEAQGRFPANLIHDNSEEVRECFPESGGGNFGNASRFFKSILYFPKASKSERNMGCEGLEEKMGGSYEFRQDGSLDGKIPIKKNNHPTVKPLALMEYLIKMITPKGGVVLDPFAGSGTTLIAAKKLGYNYIGIEKEAEYLPIITARVAAVREKQEVLF